MLVFFLNNQYARFKSGFNLIIHQQIMPGFNIIFFFWMFHQFIHKNYSSVQQPLGILWPSYSTTGCSRLNRQPKTPCSTRCRVSIMLLFIINFYDLFKFDFWVTFFRFKNFSFVKFLILLFKNNKKWSKVHPTRLFYCYKLFVCSAYVMQENPLLLNF